MATSRTSSASHEDADILEAKSGGVARCIWQVDVPVTVGGEGVQEVLCDDGLLNVGGERVGAAPHAGVQGASEDEDGRVVGFEAPVPDGHRR